MACGRRLLDGTCSHHQCGYTEETGYECVRLDGALCEAGENCVPECKHSFLGRAEFPKQLHEVMEGLREDVAEYIKDLGACDHSVGICMCASIRLVQLAEHLMRDPLYKNLTTNIRPCLDCNLELPMGFLEARTTPNGTDWFWLCSVCRERVETPNSSRCGDCAHWFRDHELSFVGPVHWVCSDCSEGRRK